MSGGIAFALLWAAVGIVLGVRWWHERARWRAEGGAHAAVAAAQRRFGRATRDGSGQRALAMQAAYAGGALAVAVGLLLDEAVVLGIGALLVNAGTVLRFLVLALDGARLDVPVLEVRRRPPRRTRPRPDLSRVLVGDLAK